MQSCLEKMHVRHNMNHCHSLVLTKYMYISVPVDLVNLRNIFNFWNVYDIMNTSGFFQSTLTLRETRSIHDSMNIPNMYC